MDKEKVQHAQLTGLSGNQLKSMIPKDQKNKTNIEVKYKSRTLFSR
jgi:hypothetical protein